MSAEHWWRRLPSREHWLLLIGVAALVFFAFSFMELTVTRQKLIARHEQAASRVERLQAQNARLQTELTREQQGDNLPGRAWQYFGQTPPGAGVIIAEPELTTPAQPSGTTSGTQEPIWVVLWKRLIAALTNR